MEVVSAHEMLAWRERAITATRKALEAAAEFDRVKPNIVKHIKGSPHIYGNDEFSLRKALEANSTLTDLSRTHNFHRDLANMLWTALATERSFMEE